MPASKNRTSYPHSSNRFACIVNRAREADTDCVPEMALEAPKSMTLTLGLRPRYPVELEAICCDFSLSFRGFMT